MAKYVQFLPLLFNTVLKILARAIRNEKGNRSHQIVKRNKLKTVFAADTIHYTKS